LAARLQSRVSTDLHYFVSMLESTLRFFMWAGCFVNRMNPQKLLRALLCN